MHSFYETEEGTGDRTSTLNTTACVRVKEGRVRVEKYRLEIEKKKLYIRNSCIRYRKYDFKVNYTGEKFRLT